MNVHRRRNFAVRGLRLLLPALAAVWLATGSADAGDTTGRWFIGGALGYETTFGSVPNNADLGADPRPDDFANREITLDDALSWSLSAGFGMTGHLILQADAGYYRDDLGPVDVYLTDAFPVSMNPLDPTNISFRNRETSLPTAAGTLTRLPVSLTGIYRFRKDSPVSPYVGAGFGMIFTDWRNSGNLGSLNTRMRNLRIQYVTDEHGKVITPPAYFSLMADGRVPMEYPVDVQVDDAREWHLTAGVEYSLRDRLSLVVDARYLYADQDIVIDLGGQDQVDFHVWSEKLFRPDGSLKYFRNNGGAPNPHIDPNDPTSAVITCALNTTGDFDHDGHRDDLCYESKLGDPKGTFLVQGGRIHLNGLSVRLGARFYF